jgi:hypothetical protein
MDGAGSYGMVTYQFEIDDETWQRWKDTLEQSKPLDERLRELIVADTEDRVVTAGEPEPDTVTQETPEELEEIIDDDSDETT